MKNNFVLITLCLFTIAFETSAQYDKNIAVGFRVGEPLGINVRKYFQYGDKAFDVNIGTYGWFYGQHRKYRDGGYHLLDNKGNFPSSQPVGAMVQGIYSWH
ncbi:MAG: hypothetical protein ACI9DJ_003282, partial [Algoriphagus sp.]